MQQMKYFANQRAVALDLNPFVAVGLVVFVGAVPAEIRTAQRIGATERSGP